MGLHHWPWPAVVPPPLLSLLLLLLPALPPGAY
jgi:hypothetical protein